MSEFLDDVYDADDCDVCPHGIGFDEECEDCEEEENADDEEWIDDDE